MNKPRFKVGQKVTYRDRATLPGGEYYHGGSNHANYIGTILSYYTYVDSKKCYNITVTCKENGSYSMLESEFLEYSRKKYNRRLKKVIL